MPSQRTTNKFAEALLKARLIDALQLKSATAHMQRWGTSLPRAVVELGFADEDLMLDALAKALRLPATHLGNVLKDNTALRALGADWCEKNIAFPISLKDRVLVLAMADPTDLDVIDTAGSLARARVTVVMAAESEIRAAIAKHFRGQELPPQRKRTSSIRQVPPPGAEPDERLELDFASPPRSGETEAPAQFTPEEMQRLDAVLQNQEKVGHILRAVQGLLAAKGFLR